MCQDWQSPETAGRPSARKLFCVSIYQRYLLIGEIKPVWRKCLRTLLSGTEYKGRQGSAYAAATLSLLCCMLGRLHKLLAAVCTARKNRVTSVSQLSAAGGLRRQSLGVRVAVVRPVHAIPEHLLRQVHLHLLEGHLRAQQQSQLMFNS